MAALFPQNWFCWIKTIPHHPIICGILITWHTLPYISIMTPFYPLRRIFQDEGGHPFVGFRGGGGGLYINACKDKHLVAKWLRFFLNCSEAGNNRVGQKTLNVVPQILGQAEMKWIYFQQNVLFISVCKTSGEPLPPQVRPTSPACGMCGWVCDAAARLSLSLC